METYYTYILQNSKSDKYYIGSTNNLEDRLKRHNLGQSKATKSGSPHWKIVYYETFESRSLAVQREYKIKKMKSRKYIAALIDKFSAD